MTIDHQKPFKWLMPIGLALLLSSCAQGYDRYMEEGRKLKEKQEYENAKKSFHYAVFEGRKDKKSPDKLVAALTAEIDCTRNLNQTDEAVKLSDEAATALEKAGKTAEAAALRKQSGDFSAAASDTISADSSYEQALADLKTAGQEKSQTAASIYMAQSDLLSAKKKYKEAGRSLQKACSIMEEISDSDSHSYAVALHKLAFIYQQLNMENEAIDCDERAKSIEISGIKGKVHKIIPKI